MFTEIYSSRVSSYFGTRISLASAFVRDFSDHITHRLHVEHKYELGSTFIYIAQFTRNIVHCSLDMGSKFEKLGYDVVFNPHGDGNCFYSSAATALKIPLEMLKSVVFDHLKANQYDLFYQHLVLEIILRPEYQGSVKGTDTFFDQQPADRHNATNNLKAYVDTENFKKVYGHRPAPPKSQLNREDAAINLNALSDLFTEKDLRLLGEKAQRLCREKNIRAGFEKNCFLVKSESQQTPHKVKRLADNGYVCDKQCLGFKSRKICAHTVAVAAHNRNVTGYVKWYQQQEQKDNLTALTTFAVNKSAGARKPARMRRNKSPDVMTQSSQLGRNTQTETLGDLMASGDRSASRYTAETSSNQPLRITFRRSKPPKPAVQPTMNTPFELIGLTTRIKKCAAGCKGKIRDGPDNFSRGDIDNKFCIRHQEHDLVWIESQQKYKKTFENKHFHLYGNCIRARNPHFDPSQVNILSSLDSGDIEILKERLN